MSEVNKLKTHYDSKISHLHDKLNNIEFENGNLREKDASLHSDLHKMRDVLMKITKKLLKVFDWVTGTSKTKLKNNVKLDFNPSDIIAMHIIPEKEESPRPILINLFRMDTKITLLRKQMRINEALKVRIDITKLNLGFLNRLFQHDHIVRSWYFNDHQWRIQKFS
ncbi:unnamed protein product [Mytilus coruscus]|uniref:Uncharacterized protein n=1 Tax=Mytilus coruscus TaxID=42192 RepID=A0A6J8C6M6_MYTCO|nr:unnamed protein product [Mytilus coruscus]